MENSKTHKNEPFRGTKMQGTRGAAKKPMSDKSDRETVEASPSSKTALYRMTYPLKDLPNLYVYEVETFFSSSKTVVPTITSGDQENPDFRKSNPKTIEPKAIEIFVDHSPIQAVSFPCSKSGDKAPTSTKKWNSIHSRKIRFKAVEELLDTCMFDLCRDSVTIHIGASRCVDHLIIPAAALAKAGKEGAWDNQKVALTKLKKLSSTLEQDGKQLYEHSIRCTISNGRSCSKDQLSDLYWKSLEVLLRKRATPITSTANFGIAREFHDKLDTIVAEEERGLKLDAIKSEPSCDHSIVLRKQISLDGDKQLLHIDFDLAVKLARNDVLTTLYGMMGGKTLHKHISGFFAAISRFTKGLRVRVRYVPRTAEDMMKGEKVTVLNYEESDNKGQTNTEIGHVFQIAEIKMPNEVPEFTFNGKATTVLDYMLKNILPANELNEEAQKFPLAHDGNGHWYPLRMLALDDAQAWTRIPHLLPAIKEVGRKVLAADDHVLRRIGEVFLKGIVERKNGEGAALVTVDADKEIEFLKMDDVAFTFL